MQEQGRDHQESIMQVRRQMLQELYTLQQRAAERVAKSQEEKAAESLGTASAPASSSNRRLPAAADGAGRADQCAGDICIYAHAEAAVARAGAAAADNDDIPNDILNDDKNK